MKLVAVKEFSYASKRLMRGQNFEASSSDARILKAIGKAKDAPVGNGVAHEPAVAGDVSVVAEVPPTVEPVPPVYQTRELVPEPPQAAAAASPPARVKRRYTRRNMTANR